MHILRWNFALIGIKFVSFLLFNLDIIFIYALINMCLIIYNNFSFKTYHNWWMFCVDSQTGTHWDELVQQILKECSFLLFAVVLEKDFQVPALEQTVLHILGFLSVLSLLHQWIVSCQWVPKQNIVTFAYTKM